MGHRRDGTRHSVGRPHVHPYRDGSLPSSLGAVGAVARWGPDHDDSSHHASALDMSQASSAGGEWEGATAGPGRRVGGSGGGDLASSAPGETSMLFGAGDLSALEDGDSEWGAAASPPRGSAALSAAAAVASTSLPTRFQLPVFATPRDGV
jgi:hypothetical protein